MSVDFFKEKIVKNKIYIHNKIINSKINSQIRTVTEDAQKQCVDMFFYWVEMSLFTFVNTYLKR